ncbi:MAG: hypothetical protein IPN20_26155 [Haliscomenobacter sp.]|nr:hypothetical protein [Haliscomenobacter sp.]
MAQAAEPLARHSLVYLEQEQLRSSPRSRSPPLARLVDRRGGPAANETKTVRNVQSDMAANTALLAMAKGDGLKLPAGLPEDIGAIYDNPLFYDEHTHGAAGEHFRDPVRPGRRSPQPGMKAAYASDAAKGSGALQEKVLSNSFCRIRPTSASDRGRVQYRAFNCSLGRASWSLHLGIFSASLAADRAVVDKRGREVPQLKRTNNLRKARWY